MTIQEKVPRAPPAGGVAALLALAPAFSLGASEQIFPEPPLQTSAQLGIWKMQSRRAQAASAAATPQLLTFLGSPDLLDALKVCCPAAALLTPSQLLGRLRRETYSAELVHSFPIAVGPSTLGHHNHGFDETLAVFAERPTFVNQWQAWLLLGNGSTPSRFDPRVSSTSTGFDPNIAETHIFGCPSFAVADRPSWTEASSRLIYIAHNLRQLDTGSTPFFGPIAAVFNTEAVKNMVLIAAVDTGIWEASCNRSAGGGGPVRSLNCSFWRGEPLGTLEHHDHLLLANVGLWASAGSSGSVVLEAAKLFGRSPLAGDGPSAYTELAPIDGNRAERYYESNLVGNPHQNSVKFLLPVFGSLFGTDTGSRVKAVAAQRGVPLVWALGDATDGELHRIPPDVPYPGNLRILDPAAASLLNVTLLPATPTAFDRAWATVSAARAALNANGALPSQQDVRDWWARLEGGVPGLLRLAPLHNASCVRGSECVGTVVGSGDCVCFSHMR